MRSATCPTPGGSSWAVGRSASAGLEALARGRQAGALERLAGREPRHRPVSGGRRDGAQRDLVDDVEPRRPRLRPPPRGPPRRTAPRRAAQTSRPGPRRWGIASNRSSGGGVPIPRTRTRASSAGSCAIGQLGHDDVQALVLQRDPQVEQRGAARERELAVQWALDPHDDVGVLDLETPRRVWRCRAPCARHRPGDRLGDRRFDVKGVSAHAPHARRRRVACHPERAVTDRGGLRTPSVR